MPFAAGGSLRPLLHRGEKKGDKHFSRPDKGDSPELSNRLGRSEKGRRLATGARDSQILL
jgi:hypothetical protein